MPFKKRKKILVLTPTLSGGSWLFTEKILEELAKTGRQVLVLSLGKKLHKNKHLSYFSLPYPHYDRWGGIPSRHPLLAFFWFLPLYILGLFFLIFYRPTLVVTNGCSLGAILAPFAKLFKKHFVLMYHTCLYRHRGLKNIVSRTSFTFMGKIADLAVVNSADSYEDISVIMPPQKVIINNLWADNLFFAGPIPERTGATTFNILYVGRLDEDKVCIPLIEIAKKLKSNNEFSFTFVGVGGLDPSLRQLSRTQSNIKYLGYIKEREKLKDLYQDADLVWSNSDKNYLSIPALEALASGTPIMIPNQPGLLNKIEDKIEVEKSLVPPQIGWLVEVNNLENIIDLIFQIKSKGISKEMRRACRDYAEKNYSERNLEKTVKAVNEIME